MSPPNRLGGIESDKHGMMEFWSNGVMEYWGIGITFNNWLHVLDLHRKESLTNPKGKLGCRPIFCSFPPETFSSVPRSICFPFPEIACDVTVLDHSITPLAVALLQS